MRKRKRKEEAECLRHSGCRKTSRMVAAFHVLLLGLLLLLMAAAAAQVAQQVRPSEDKHRTSKKREPTNLMTRTVTVTLTWLNGSAILKNVPLGSTLLEEAKLCRRFGVLPRHLGRVVVLSVNGDGKARHNDTTLRLLCDTNGTKTPIRLDLGLGLPGG